MKKPSNWVQISFSFPVCGIYSKISQATQRKREHTVLTDQRRLKHLRWSQVTSLLLNLGFIRTNKVCPGNALCEYEIPASWERWYAPCLTYLLGNETTEQFSARLCYATQRFTFHSGSKQCSALQSTLWWEVLKHLLHHSTYLVPQSYFPLWFCILCK